jgi:hypothetical protein
MYEEVGLHLTFTTMVCYYDAEEKVHLRIFFTRMSVSLV